MKERIKYSRVGDSPFNICGEVCARTTGKFAFIMPYQYNRALRNQAVENEGIIFHTEKCVVLEQNNVRYKLQAGAR